MTGLRRTALSTAICSAQRTTAPAPDVTFATLLAGVPIQRRHAGQFGRARITDRSQFGHEGQQRGAGDRTQTFDGFEVLRLRLKCRSKWASMSRSSLAISLSS